MQKLSVLLVFGNIKRAHGLFSLLIMFKWNLLTRYYVLLWISTPSACNLPLSRFFLNFFQSCFLPWGKGLLAEFILSTWVIRTPCCNNKQRQNFRALFFVNIAAKIEIRDNYYRLQPLWASRDMLAEKT